MARLQSGFIGMAPKGEAFVGRLPSDPLARRRPDFNAIAIEAKHLSIGCERHVLPRASGQPRLPVVFADARFNAVLSADGRRQAVPFVYAEPELTASRRFRRLRWSPILCNRCFGIAATASTHADTDSWPLCEQG